MDVSGRALDACCLLAVMLDGLLLLMDIVLVRYITCMFDHLETLLPGADFAYVWHILLVSNLRHT